MVLVFNLDSVCQYVVKYPVELTNQPRKPRKVTVWQEICPSRAVWSVSTISRWTRKSGIGGIVVLGRVVWLGVSWLEGVVRLGWNMFCNIIHKIIIKHWLSKKMPDDVNCIDKKGMSCTCCSQ